MNVPTGTVGGLDYVASRASLPDGAETLFKPVKPDKGQRLVVFGWAMAEALSAQKLPK
jgi:hypothetical protein